MNREIEVIESISVINVNDPDAIEINQEYDLFTCDLQSGLLHALRCGELLIAVKAKLPHGDFEDWILANCKFKKTFAEKSMQLAYAKAQNSVLFDNVTSVNSALKLLAEAKKKTAIEKAVDKVMDWVQDKLSVKHVNSLDGIFKRVMVAKASHDNPASARQYLNAVREKCIRIVNFIDGE